MAVVTCMVSLLWTIQWLQYIASTLYWLYIAQNIQGTTKGRFRWSIFFIKKWKYNQLIIGTLHAILRAFRWEPRDFKLLSCDERYRRSLNYSVLPWIRWHKVLIVMYYNSAHIGTIWWKYWCVIPLCRHTYLGFAIVPQYFSNMKLLFSEL